MPENEEIIVKCQKWNCYWNIGKYKSNCACSKVVITDKICEKYIEREEAKRRLSNRIEMERNEIS